MEKGTREGEKRGGRFPSFCPGKGREERKKGKNSTGEEKSGGQLFLSEKKEKARRGKRKKRTLIRRERHVEERGGNSLEGVALSTLWGGRIPRIVLRSWKREICD